MRLVVGMIGIVVGMCLLAWLASAPPVASGVEPWIVPPLA